MKAPSDLHQPNVLSHSASTQGVNIDIRRILYHATRFWYFIVLSLFVALTIAYLRNRYAVRIYPVTASIIIREQQETSEGKFIYNNPLVSGFRNYLNELYIIKSYPLIERTIDELGFETSFARVGNLLTTETYKYLPVKVELLNKNEVGGRQFFFEIVDGERFKIIASEVKNSAESSRLYQFGDTVSFNNLKVIFHLTDKTNIERFKNDPLLFIYTPIQSLTGTYVGKLSANWAEEGAGVINLNVNGPDTKKDIDFLNGLIRQYQAYDLEKKNQAALRSIDFIGDQLTGITDSLNKAERQLEQFKDKNIITDLSSETTRLYQKMEELELQKTELIVHDKYYQYLTEYIETGKGLDQIILPTSVGISDEILSKLMADMIDMQFQIKLQVGKERSQNPFVQDKLTRIDELKKNIIESVRNQKSIDKIKLDFLDKGIGALEKQLNYLPIAERQLVSIKRNYSLLENLYIFLLQKKAEAGISKASTTSDIAIVNPPMRAGAPISPLPQKDFLIAFILGVGLPLGVFGLMELLNTKIQSKEDIDKITRIPFISGLGHKNMDDNLEVLKHPKTAIAESFRALRSNLSYFLGRKENAVIMITSSISGEGKTFTSINLASILNLSGKRVLIVGADMRKPKLYTDFGLHNAVGLSSYLAGISSFEEVVQHTDYENLDLVSGGPIPPNPAELLLTEKLNQFILQARQRYDYIVVDTPPVAIVTDAFSILDLVDHTLFLVRQNYTPKALMKTAEDFYSSGKLKNVSLVLNDIYRSGPGYGYSYSYNYGYTYGSRNKNGYGYYTES